MPVRFLLRSASAVLAFAVLAGPLAGSAMAQAPTAGPPPGSFQAGGYGDTTLRGAYGSATFFFPIPAGQVATAPAQLDLDISHSPLLLAERSTLTVVANGTSIASAFLTPQNADRGRLSATVPVDSLRGAGLVVEVRGFLRLTRDDCEEPNNPALWATVHGTSALRLTTGAGGRDLSDVSRYLVTSGGRRTPLVVPSFDVEHLAAAGSAAVAIGRAAAAANADPLLDVTTDASPSVDGGIALVRRGEIPTVSVEETGPLRVTAAASDAAGLRTATRALGGPTSRSFRGTVVEVRGEVAGPPRSSLPWRRGAASFAQLGFDRRDLRGPGSHVVDIAAGRPSGWRLDRDGTLSLDVDVAPGARRDTSFVQAELNGTELGRQRLTPDGRTHTYRFRLPAGLLESTIDGRRVRDLALRVTLHLEPTIARCTPVAADAAQASLLPTSSVELRHEWADDAEVGRFPHPVHGNGVQALVVLPSDPDKATVKAGLQILAAIARWAEPSSGAPGITTADRLTERQQQRRGLVLVGSADGELGESIDVGDAPAASEPGDSTAVLGVTSSPWSRSRQVLVVHGDPTGIALAAEVLSGRSTLADLVGQQVAISGVPGAGAGQQLRRDADATSPVELSPAVDVPVDRTPALVASVGLLAFLAIVSILSWQRWGRGRTS